MSKTSTDTIAADAPRRHVLNGTTMGTRYSAIFYGPDRVDPALPAALFAAVDTVDRQMSNWKSESDLSRLNRAPVGAWVEVPQEMFEVLKTALHIGKLSGGAFDIGVGDAVNAWGFGPGGRQATDAVSAPASGGRPGSGDVLELDVAASRVRKHMPLTLDLCGIAKGFGVDEMARCLDRFGITSYLVGIDGEMRARGEKPGREPWAVAVERPDREHRDVLGVMTLEDGAIATSGDYRHFAEVNGEMVSHTIDPSEGRPVKNPVASVTVLARTCMEADALATALMVLGEKKGVAFALSRQLDALFVLRKDGKLSEIGLGRFGGA
ncbi:thiamine biosynthesis lipoprotein [Ciceribacter lividus]|uniref:FAD:protein FMN transferase n=1 Tax=Ciceribacter lividus TaxID=1197950 RepID=A0A6I7HHS7_9HYPH|nr:FAD:protein FMN transferase [Ciceribacter lividus]RCW21083.1 thiamine biosynthesis lipoprotein [Ciceribacter lividus]